MFFLCFFFLFKGGEIIFYVDPSYKIVKMKTQLLVSLVYENKHVDGLNTALADYCIEVTQDFKKVT